MSTFIYLLFSFLLGLGINFSPCVISIANKTDKRSLNSNLLFLFYFLASQALISTLIQPLHYILIQILDVHGLLIFTLFVLIMSVLKAFNLMNLNLFKTFRTKVSLKTKGRFGLDVFSLAYLYTSSCTWPSLCFVFCLGLLENTWKNILSLSLPMCFGFVLGLSVLKTKTKHLRPFLHVPALLLLLMLLHLSRHLMSHHLFLACIFALITFCVHDLVPLKMKKKATAITILFFLIGLILFYTKSIDQEQSKSIPHRENIEWQNDEKEALIRARDKNKPIILDFWADWCLPCKEMDVTTYQDEMVVSLIKQHFIALKIDSSSVDENTKSLFEKYDVTGLPKTVFIKPNGQVIQQLSFSGYVDEKEMIEILSKVMDETKPIN